MLRKYLLSYLPYDYSFNRPSKKFGDMIMPGVVKESVDLVVHVDTSGSINEDELSQFMSEVIGILKSHNNVNITLLDCDADINSVTNLNSRSPPKFNLKGGGGTSHEPVVDWVKKNKVNCKCLVTLTDGYSDIENCFNELCCDKIIVLCKDSVDEKHLEGYGKVVKVE